MANIISEFAVRKIPERFFHWDSLLLVSRTPLSAIGIYATLVIPSVGIFLSFLSIIEVVGSQPFSGVGLPISMLAAYFSALAFSAASIATTLFCPHDVQVYTNFKTYLFALLDVGNSLQNATLKEKKSNPLLQSISLSKENQKDMERFIRELTEKKASEDFFETYQKVIENSPSEWSKALEDKPRARHAIGLIYLVSISVAAILFFVRAPIYILTSI